MNSAPSASQHHERVPWPAPRPFDIQNWPTSPPSNMQNSERRTTGRRIVRALASFFIAVFIGAGVTLAWQSYGDEAMEMVRTEAPSLAWLLPVSTTKSSAAATSAELVQQLKPVALDLAIVRHSLEQLAIKVEQLAAKQDQMVQNIATLQSVEQEISQKLSSPPQSRAVPPRKPPQPTAQSSATQSSSVPPPPPLH
jgi:TolA-binding protein